MQADPHGATPGLRRDQLGAQHQHCRTRVGERGGPPPDTAWGQVAASDACDETEGAARAESLPQGGR